MALQLQYDMKHTLWTRYEILNLSWNLVSSFSSIYGMHKYFSPSTQITVLIQLTDGP